MSHDLDEDVFFSYAQEDLESVRSLARTLWERYRIASFVAEDALRDLTRGTDKWESELLRKVTRCRFFVLFASRSASASQWVSRECNEFFSNAYTRDNSRRIFVLLKHDPPAGTAVPQPLQNFLHHKTDVDLVHEVARALVACLKDEKRNAQNELEQRTQQLSEEREIAAVQVRAAFHHYGQTRFWKPFSRANLHIFTCGRDTASTKHRGAGGRTNIDLWDFRTVLEIRNFFTEHYPSTDVKIEDPVAKLVESDLQGPELGHRVANLMRQLEDKDCVIVGSPDVSDFAEIVLAELHGTSAFKKGREKKRGFALVKGEMNAPSSTYWLKTDGEEVGIKWIEQNRSFSPREDEDGRGKTYGIFVVCDNPFSREPKQNKVIMLSGFTGVATYGMARLLTSEGCQKEFFKVDERFGSHEASFEALVGIPYLYDFRAKDQGDKRQIDPGRPVTVEEMVEIPPRP